MIKYKYITREQFRRKWYALVISGGILYSVCYALHVSLMKTSSLIEGLSLAGLLIMGFGFGFGHGVLRKIKENKSNRR